MTASVRSSCGGDYWAVNRDGWFLLKVIATHWRQFFGKGRPRVGEPSERALCGWRLTISEPTSLPSASAFRLPRSASRRNSAQMQVFKATLLPRLGGP